MSNFLTNAVTLNWRKSFKTKHSTNPPIREIRVLTLLLASLTANEARHFDIEPRIAMLSFSNFGSNNHPFAEKVQQAVKILHQRRPDLTVFLFLWYYVYRNTYFRY